MSTIEHRTYELWCDHPGCRKKIGRGHGPPAEMRKLAAQRGWKYRRSPIARNLGLDYCKEHGGKEAS